MGALVMLVVACGGETAANTPSGFTRQVDVDGHCSIAFPDAWQVKKQTMGMALLGLAAREGESDQFTENVNVVTEQIPEDMGLDEYTRRSLKHARKILTDFEQLDRQHKQIGSREVVFVEFKHRMGQISIHASQTYVVGEGRAYVITCSAEPAQYEKYRDRFEKVVGSFAIE
jgi:serine/threonine-protein kinase